jgi:acyl-homoserine lactone acylase PvdQ
MDQLFVKVQHLGVTEDGLLVANPHQKVEMIGHQAVGKSLADGINVVGVSFQEIAVVVVGIKEIFAANGVVVKMVILSWAE